MEVCHNEQVACMSPLFRNVVPVKLQGQFQPRLRPTRHSIAMLLFPFLTSLSNLLQGTHFVLIFQRGILPQTQIDRFLQFQPTRLL